MTDDKRDGFGGYSKDELAEMRKRHALLATQPIQPAEFAFYEARRLPFEDGIKSADLRREDGRGLGILHGWSSQHMAQNPDKPVFLTTIPRDGRNGLPRDWAIDVTSMFVASSVGLEGRLWLEQNDDTVHVITLHGGPSFELHCDSMTRLAGTTAAADRSDKFEMRLAGTIADAQTIDMAPIHALADALLAAFDTVHPGDGGRRYILDTHRAHLEQLRRLPPGPWIVAGIAGPTNIVIV